MVVSDLPLHPKGAFLPQYSVGRLMKDAGQAEQVRTALDALGVRQAWKVMEAEKKKEDIMK